MRKSSSDSFPHTFFSIFPLLCAYHAHWFPYQVRTAASLSSRCLSTPSFLQLLLVSTGGTMAPWQPQPQAPDVKRLTQIRYELPKPFPCPSGIFSANFLLCHAQILPGCSVLVSSHIQPWGCTTEEVSCGAWPRRPGAGAAFGVS